jgi:hypothetical protein
MTVDQSPSYPPPAPPPSYPPYAPQPFQQAPYTSPFDLARQSAAMRSYVTPAVITLVLYCVLWIPGLIANIVYLSAANEDRRTSGLEPQGRGCLIALLGVFIGLPLLACVGFVGIGALGVGLGAIVGTPQP